MYIPEWSRAAWDKLRAHGNSGSQTGWGFQTRALSFLKSSSYPLDHRSNLSLDLYIRVTHLKWDLEKWCGAKIINDFV